LIAAATADRSVLAIGHDFAVIPVMAFFVEGLTAELEAGEL
jgi:hypothetical protein